MRQKILLCNLIYLSLVLMRGGKRVSKFGTRFPPLAMAAISHQARSRASDSDGIFTFNPMVEGRVRSKKRK